MSTKKLHEALERLSNGNPESAAIAEDALVELEAIENAAVFVTALAPAEVVKAFNENPRNPAVLDWLRGTELLCTIAREAN